MSQDRAPREENSPTGSFLTHCDGRHALKISRSRTEKGAMTARNQPRISVRYPVMVENDGRAAPGRLVNLSRGGYQIHSDLDCGPGSYLALRITMPYATDPVAVELSVVRWKQDDRLGLEFVRYGEGDRDRLTELTETMTSAEGVPSDQAAPAFSSRPTQDDSIAPDLDRRPQSTELLVA